MRAVPGDEAGWDLTALPIQVREALLELTEQREVTLSDGDRLLGTVTYTPAVLEGLIIKPETAPRDARAVPPPQDTADVTVVATATKLSDAARSRLSDSLGPNYIVLDIAQAPPTADVVLIHAVSPQLIGLLSANFPRARIMIAELLDDKLGLDVRGPVGRLLDAGAHAYLPRGPVEQVGRGVKRVLETGSAPELHSTQSATASAPELEAPQHAAQVENPKERRDWHARPHSRVLSRVTPRVRSS